MPATKPADVSAAGHRQRLKARFTEKGLENLADYEVLELLLTYTIPRRDVKPIAKRLMAAFGTLSGTLRAPHEKLAAIEGLGESSSQFLKLLEAITARFRQEVIRHRPAFENELEMLDYLHARLGSLAHEEFHVIYLDAKNHIIDDACLFTGTINASAVYPREVIKAALDKGAVGMVLAHNHPSGDVQPSQADKDVTQLLQQAARPIGIRIHDHVIIGGGKHFCFRKKGLMGC